MTELEKEKTQAEMMIKGAPYEFALVARQFAYELASIESGNIPRYAPIDGSQTYPGTNPVIFILATGDERTNKGAIVVHWIPAGSLLRVNANSSDWPALKESWELLREELDLKQLIIRERL